VVQAAMTDVLSEPPNITGMNACTDAALMQAAGTPAPADRSYRRQLSRAG